MGDKEVWTITIKFFREENDDDIVMIRVYFGNEQEAKDYMQKVGDDIMNAVECGETICIDNINIDTNEIIGHEISINYYIIFTNYTPYSIIEDMSRDNRYRKCNNLRNEVS